MSGGRREQRADFIKELAVKAHPRRVGGRGARRPPPRGAPARPVVAEWGGARCTACCDLFAHARVVVRGKKLGGTTCTM